MKFKIFFSVSVQNVIGTLTGFSVKFLDYFGRYGDFNNINSSNALNMGRKEGRKESRGREKKGEEGKGREGEAWKERMREGGIGKGGREEEGSREGAKDYVMMDMLIKLIVVIISVHAKTSKCTIFVCQLYFNKKEYIHVYLYLQREKLGS